MPKKKKIQRKSIDKTKTIPKPKASIEELQESRNGGQIALRGYSYQFLYSCYLMLSCKDENTVFNLEGIEEEGDEGAECYERIHVCCMM